MTHKRRVRFSTRMLAMRQSFRLSWIRWHHRRTARKLLRREARLRLLQMELDSSLLQLKTLEEHLLILEHSERELLESKAFREAGSPQQHRMLLPAEQQVFQELESMPPL